MIYPGYSQKKNTSENKALFYKNFPKNEKRELNDYERGRLDDLREWSSQFFAQNSLTYVNWWNWHEKETKNVDFIVQFKEIKENYMVLINDK